MDCNATVLSAGISRSTLNFDVEISQTASSTEFTLATLTFTGLAASDDYTSIDFDDRNNAGRLDAEGVRLYFGGTNIYSGELNENFAVSTSPVPLPVAAWLL